MRTQNGTLSKYLQNAWVIIISIVAISLIAGGSVYLWKNSDSEDYEQKLHQQILLLQNQVRELQKKNTDLKTIKDSSPAISSDISSDIEFPVVSYTRQGLLTGTEEGRAEKKNLEEKLISPYADYHNENRVRVVAMGCDLNRLSVIFTSKKVKKHLTGF